MNAPDTLTYREIADLSCWAEVQLWGITLPPIAHAPIFLSLAQAVSMDSAALEAIQRHNAYVERHQKEAPSWT